MLSFYRWLDLQRRADDAVPDDVTIAMLTSRAGGNGLTLDQLRRESGLAFDVLDVLLRRLLSTGQIIPARVKGQRVFRTAL